MTSLIQVLLLGGTLAAAPAPDTVVSVRARLDGAAVTTLIDMIEQRIVDKLRGQPIGNFIPGVQGNFSTSLSTSDIVLPPQAVVPSQKGEVDWVLKKNLPGRPEAITFVTWANYSKARGEFSQTLSKGYSSTHEWSTTETLDVGVSLEISVGIPDEAGMKESVSESISISSTNTQSETVDQQQSFSITHPVPANSNLYAAIVATPLTLEADWSATMVVEAHGFVRGNLGVPLAFSLSALLTEAERTFPVSGTYSGVVGSNFAPCTETWAVDQPRPGHCP